MAEAIIINRKRFSKPLINFTYTGKYKYINEGRGNWKIKFLTSGVLTVAEYVDVDIFLVGGGAGGRQSYNNGTGGGSGYTKTVEHKRLFSTGSYDITVGAGGTPAYSLSDTNGEDSKFRYDGSDIVAEGGQGINGGCGGGNIDGDGGTDGSNGGNSGGTGQGTTTREFSEEDGKLYAGGGGGFNGSGGEGGGGNGATGTATATTPQKNTGSGGGGSNITDSGASAGADGIVIIRNTARVGITTQPANKTADENAYVDFTVSAYGRITGYQWQFLVPGGVWANTSLTGNKTNTLHVQALSYRNNYQYRCIITGTINSVTSNPATLTVTGVSQSSISVISVIDDMDKFRE